MEKVIKANITFCVIYECVLIFVLLRMESKQMKWWQTLLIAVVPAAITTLATYIVTLKSLKKSQLSQNTESINKLKDKIGKFENRTLENMLGVTTDESLSGQFSKIREQFDKDIGIHLTNKYSLTAQHDMILNYMKEKEKQNELIMASFSSSEKNTKAEIEQIQCFFKDWEMKIVEISKLKKQLIDLQNKYDLSLAVIESLENQLELSQQHNNTQYNNPGRGR